MKRFIFQCNANKYTGLGHLSRCLNIALALQQSSQKKIIFSGQYNQFATELLFQHKLEYNTTDKVTFTDSDTLILDDYNLNQSDIEQIRNRVNIFVKIDDFHDLDLSSLDLVINFRLNAESADYANNYRAKETCLGLGYFPFHQKLIEIRAKNKTSHLTKVSNIFIFIGGEDKHAAGIKLLSLIDGLVTNKNLFLIDKSHSASTEVITNNKRKNHHYYLPLTANMAEYYQQADIFISGGGLSKYEAAFCLIANAAISQNNGQAIDTKMLAKEGLTFDLGLSEELTSNPDKVRQALFQFFNTACQNDIINHCKNKFSHNSTKAVADAIDSL